MTFWYMNNSDFHILNLSAYQTPEVTENPNEEWVAYGDDNNYYKELIDAFHGYWLLITFLVVV